MQKELTGYWTFFCNPAIWEIDKFLSTNIEYDNYRVNDWYKNYIQPGQLAIIRVGIDKRTKEQLINKNKLNPGIYAIVEILNKPRVLPVKSDFYLKDNENGQERLRVKIRYLKNLLNNPLSLEILKQNPITNQDKYLIEGFQRSCMPLKKDVFDEIIKILGAEQQIFNNIENETIHDNQEIINLELKYQNASPQVKEVISKRIERGKISSEIKKVYKYKCKICESLGLNPYSFQKTNGEYYIETHHLIPVSNLLQGSLGISNLITVCANHHRQFHFGNIEIIDNTHEALILSIDGRKIEIEKMKL